MATKEEYICSQVITPAHWYSSSTSTDRICFKRPDGRKNSWPYILTLKLWNEIKFVAYFQRRKLVLKGIVALVQIHHQCYNCSSQLICKFCSFFSWYTTRRSRFLEECRWWWWLWTISERTGAGSSSVKRRLGATRALTSTTTRRHSRAGAHHPISSI